MDFTTDKLRSMVRKWQTLIEAHVDVKTTDGFTLRMFCIAFTKKRQGQIKRTAYAQSSQVRGEGGIAWYVDARGWMAGISESWGLLRLGCVWPQLVKDCVDAEGGDCVPGLGLNEGYRVGDCGSVKEWDSIKATVDAHWDTRLPQQPIAEQPGGGGTFLGGALMFV